VKVIVDANIVFSGILNTNGKIADLLINSRKKIQFIAPEFLRFEISKHYSKISKLSGLTIGQIREAEYQVCRDIIFISEEQISNSAWVIAEKVVSDIDPNDTPYMAYAKHFRCKIWSGDKKLIKGLTKKGIQIILTTDELFRWRKEKG
jgi:predicted nucleic acid-binding protein